ncbi:response regulator transcription factor [Roseiarcus sp.]|uniref:response regulator transcription factor n=1 Tax=Roseiarcus sp. TaxID=1969460 RepID=UPI003F95495A
MRFAMSLSTRENEIVKMIAGGLSNKEIARRLNIEVSTTKSHVHNLLSKLGLQSRAQVAYWARLQDGHSR